MNVAGADLGPPQGGAQPAQQPPLPPQQPQQPAPGAGSPGAACSRATGAGTIGYPAYLLSGQVPRPVNGRVSR
jgi:hypothetical protein